MKTSRFRLLLTATFLAGAVLAPALRAADMAAARKGRARLLTSIERGKGGAVSVPLTIDVSDVLFDGSRPAVLGAYVVAVEFDPEKVVFVDAARGKAPEFADAPAATPAAKANKNGFLKVVGDHGQADNPTGIVSVAVLHFRELVPGGADSIRPRFDSLASSLRRDHTGQFPNDINIPFDLVK